MASIRGDNFNRTRQLKFDCALRLPTPAEGPMIVITMWIANVQVED
jgi:hypothetical protein